MAPRLPRKRLSPHTATRRSGSAGPTAIVPQHVSSAYSISFDWRSITKNTIDAADKTAVEPAYQIFTSSRLKIYLLPLSRSVGPVFHRSRRQKRLRLCKELGGRSHKYGTPTMCPQASPSVCTKNGLGHDRTVRAPHANIAPPVSLLERYMPTEATPLRQCPSDVRRLELPDGHNQQPAPQECRTVLAVAASPRGNPSSPPARRFTCASRPAAPVTHHQGTSAAQAAAPPTQRRWRYAVPGHRSTR